jgi:hypothetical protein
MPIELTDDETQLIRDLLQTVKLHGDITTLPPTIARIVAILHKLTPPPPPPPKETKP